MTERWLNQKALADEMGYSVRQMAEWTARADSPKKKVSGAWQYRWPAFNRWWADQKVADALARAKPVEFEDAKVRRMSAEASLAEIELAKQRGELVEVELFRAALLDAFGRVRSRLRDFPARAASVVAGKRSAADIRLALNKLSDEVIAELRNDPVPDDTAEPPSKRAVKRSTRPEAEAQ